MNLYNFYYDETEHSRKINYKTITADNYYDNFITAIVGWDIKNEESIKARYLEFEEKYKGRKSNEELKSTTIKQQQLEYGFASLNKQNTEFLYDFLSLFDNDTMIYFSVTSKIEYIILQLFKNYESNTVLNMENMKYSITKALIVYQPMNVIKCIYENPESLIIELKKFFETTLHLNKDNLPLKKRENQAFKQILYLLNEINENVTFDWNYKTQFIGFKKYLNENDIDKYSLIIDKEGEKGKTLNSAREIGLKNIMEQDSKDYFGIRMADMLAGIIGKVQKSLHKAITYTADDFQRNKKLLTYDWFDLNERQLDVYKEMYKVIIEINQCWYKAYGGIYSDDLVSFVALLGFINQFGSIQEIKENIDMLGEYYNSYVCENLKAHYKRINEQGEFEIPFELINKNNQEFFLNERGAKVYYESSKQPKLVIPSGGSTLDVLSVGFNKENIPLITIVENDNINCYRLPTELLDWIITLTGIAHMGEKLLPAKVIFSQTINGYCADIL